MLILRNISHPLSSPDEGSTVVGVDPVWPPSARDILLKTEKTLGCFQIGYKVQIDSSRDAAGIQEYIPLTLSFLGYPISQQPGVFHSNHLIRVGALCAGSW